MPPRSYAFKQPSWKLLRTASNYYNSVLRSRLIDHYPYVLEILKRKLPNLTKIVTSPTCIVIQIFNHIILCYPSWKGTYGNNIVLVNCGIVIIVYLSLPWCIIQYLYNISTIWEQTNLIVVKIVFHSAYIRP